MDLTILKNKYAALAKKNKLPDFNEINENFEIDKIDKDTDFMIRLVRKVMMEKIVNSIGFLEMLLNPVNAPRMYLQYTRSLKPEDRKNIEQIYSRLAELVLRSLGLEVEYSEKTEAEMIRNIYSTWKSVRAPFKSIIDSMISPENSDKGEKREKTYFG